MGYQESWVIVKPQWQFSKMMQIYRQQRDAGFYNDIYSTAPMSVVVLKQKIGKLPAGTKILWVCGERCWQDQQHIFNQNVSHRLFCRMEIIPIEAAVTEDLHPPANASCDELLGTLRDRLKLYTDGIDFEDKAPPNENAYMKRYSPGDYLEHIKPNLER